MKFSAAYGFNSRWRRCTYVCELGTTAVGEEGFEKEKKLNGAEYGAEERARGSRADCWPVGWFGSSRVGGGLLSYTSRVPVPVGGVEGTWR